MSGEQTKKASASPSADTGASFGTNIGTGIGTGFSFSSDLANAAKALKKGERTKAAIQIAVCKCLENAPLADLTIAGICDHANISHGTFYIYFPNRNMLVADVLMRFSAFVQAKMRQASKQGPGRPSRAATSAYMHLFEQNLGLMKCLLRHPDDFPEAKIAFQGMNCEWLETVVAATTERLQISGQPIDRDELMRRAYALGGMIDQYLAGLLLDRDPNMAPFSQDREAIIDTLNLLWERGMEP